MLYNTREQWNSDITPVINERMKLLTEILANNFVKTLNTTQDDVDCIMKNIRKGNTNDQINS